MKKNPFDYQESLEKLSNDQLIEAFNRQVGVQGWGNARASYGRALRNEFLKRDFDSTLIISAYTFSFAKKVIMQNKRLIFMDTQKI